MKISAKFQLYPPYIASEEFTFHKISCLVARTTNQIEAILPLLLIQEGHLSVTGERMCTKYW